MAHRPRTKLHEILVNALGDGTQHVYFQPPTNQLMEYPCIRYTVNRNWAAKADNLTYIGLRQYSVIVIDRNPDSQIAERLSDLEYCELDRTYVSDNLNHFVFTLYY